MIDTEHLDMDKMDNESDALQRLIHLDQVCVLCGKEAMPDAMYCYECWQKWGDIF